MTASQATSQIHTVAFICNQISSILRLEVDKSLREKAQLFQPQYFSFYSSHKSQANHSGTKTVCLGWQHNFYNGDLGAIYWQNVVLRMASLTPDRSCTPFRKIIILLLSLNTYIVTMIF